MFAFCFDQGHCSRLAAWPKAFAKPFTNLLATICSRQLIHIVLRFTQHKVPVIANKTWDRLDRNELPPWHTKEQNVQRDRIYKERPRNIEGKEETKSLKAMTRICLPLHRLDNEMCNNRIVQKRYHSMENRKPWPEVFCFRQNDIRLNVYILNPTKSRQIIWPCCVPTANDHWQVILSSLPCDHAAALWPMN